MRKKITEETIMKEIKQDWELDDYGYSTQMGYIFNVLLNVFKWKHVDCIYKPIRCANDLKLRVSDGLSQEAVVTYKTIPHYEKPSSGIINTKSNVNLVHSIDEFNEICQCYLLKGEKFSAYFEFLNYELYLVSKGSLYKLKKKNMEKELYNGEWKEINIKENLRYVKVIETLHRCSITKMYEYDKDDYHFMKIEGNGFSKIIKSKNEFSKKNFQATIYTDDNIVKKINNRDLYIKSVNELIDKNISFISYDSFDIYDSISLYESSSVDIYKGNFKLKDIELNDSSSEKDITFDDKSEIYL